MNDPATNRGRGDGVYGRFNGDLSYRFALGVDLDFGTETARPLIQGDLVFYHSVGVYGAFAERIAPRDALQRSVSLGLTFTPLFLLRWSSARESGFAFWDLTLDSLGLAAGVQLAEPRYAAFAREPGFEVGFLLGLPLLARANGPWLRLRGNLVTGRPPLPDQERVEGALWLSLGWEGFFHAGILKVD